MNRAGPTPFRRRPAKSLLLLTALALAGLLAALLAAGPAAEARPKLQRCDIGTKRAFRCGQITVPAVRGLPSAGKQKIGFAIRPRGDRSRPSKGAIVFIEGGPGYAATNSDSIRPTAAVFAPFLKRYELIAVDQRGTGRSSPVRCRGLQRERMAWNRAVRQCARQLGPRRQGFTTAESAEDLEAVRRALGLKGVILYGDSYGTYLGQSYAARHGRHLKGLILSSAYPGNDPFWRTLYPAATRAIRVSCRRSPNCSGDALGRFRRVLRQAGTGSGLTHEVLAYLMGDASNYAPGGYHRLNRAVSRWLRGDRSALRRLTAPLPPGAGPSSYFSTGMYVATICNDYPVPWDRSAGLSQRRRQFNRAIAGFRPRDLFAPLTRRQWMTDSASDIGACIAWPAPTPRMEPPIPPGRKMPARLRTLVLAGGFDSITSVKEARQVTRRFPRGRLFVVPGRGHASELYFPFTSKGTPRIRHFVRNLD